MSNECAVCKSYRPEANLRQRKLTKVFFGDRGITMCEMHRRIAENNGVETWEALRELYGEPDGRRSYVPRRSEETSAAPNAERRQRGRRATDMV